MVVSPILGPSGEPTFSVGGANAWKVESYRSLNVSLEWAKRGRQFLRCLCIWPQTLPGAPAPGVWTIAHTAIVHFLDFDNDGKTTGKPSRFAFDEAREALQILGKDRNDKQALFEVIDCVVRWGPELALMPVAPLAVRRRLTDEAMWDMEVKDADGRTKNEASV